MSNLNKSNFLFLDVDNTLNTKDLDSNIQLHNDFKNLYLKLISNKQVKIFYNTTRGIARLLDILCQNNEVFYTSGIVSALNGAVIYDLKSGRQIKSFPMSTKTSRYISQWFTETDSIEFAALFTDNDIYGKVFIKDKILLKSFYNQNDSSFNFDIARCTSDISEFSSWIQKNKCTLIEIKLLNSSAINALKETTSLEVSFDGSYYVTSKGVNKAKGIEYIKSIYKEDAKPNIIVAGDSFTDIVMFNNDNKANILVGHKIGLINTMNTYKVKDPAELCLFLSKLLI